VEVESEHWSKHRSFNKLSLAPRERLENVESFADQCPVDSLHDFALPKLKKLIRINVSVY